jgi:hypothetical protein
MEEKYNLILNYLKRNNWSITLDYAHNIGAVKNGHDIIVYSGKTFSIDNCDCYYFQIAPKETYENYLYSVATKIAIVDKISLIDIDYYIFNIESDNDLSFKDKIDNLRLELIKKIK